MSEFSDKCSRVRTFLREQDRDGLLLATNANFAWLSGGGRNHVGVTTERGIGGLLVTRERVFLLADNIELRRLLEEEVAGLDLEPVEFPWWSGGLADAVLERVRPQRLAADLPLPGVRLLSAEEQMALRNPLLPAEIDRYRALGRDVAVVLTHAAFHCRRGMTEHMLAGMLARGLTDFGITPAVTLVAVDDRVFSRRHPLPTDRRLEEYALLVVGGRRAGLHLSASRVVHFGPVPAELAARHAACARVDAAFIEATRPGTPLAAIFRAGQGAYAAEGYPDEWKEHHQGGPTGYAGRELRATPSTPGAAQLHQAFAWNPSIRGTKSEDTLLVAEDGPELLSRTPDLPELEVERDGDRFPRPAILVR